MSIGAPGPAKLGPGGTDSPRFCMGPMLRQLEQRIKCSALLNPRFNLSFVGPLGQKGSYHQQCAPHCSRGADQMCSLFSVLLLAVPEAVSSHIKVRSRTAVHFKLCVAPRCSQRQFRPIQKGGAGQLCSPFSVLLLAVPEAVSSHTKVRSISSAGLSLCRELCLWDGNL